MFLLVSFCIFAPKNIEFMEFFHVITQGILFGFTLSFMVGPAFFSLLQTSITHGFKAGANLAFGISCSDIIMVFISWFGLSSLFASEKAQLIIGLIGGTVIIIFGVYNFTKKQVMQPTRDIEQIKTKFHFKYFAKGFVFNVANPGVWIYWLLPISVASSYETNEQILFLAFILITVLLMDIVKCAIANELKNFLTIKVVLVINRVVGVILILFGIYLACSPFFPDVNLLDISK